MRRMPRRPTSTATANSISSCPEPHSTVGLFGQEFTDGVAYVLEGHGDGTFAAPVSYPAGRGAYQIVVGDFTRDGILDIATGNRSTVFRDDCGPGAKTWDSLSILPGNGNGTFTAASSFSVGNQMNVDSERFRNTLSSLNTSDIDADGATDLIVSHGVIFKNRPADPNWAPTVTATATEPGGGSIVFIKAVANDVDQDMLTYSWTDSAGSPTPPIPSPCFSENTRGIHTFTVTVDDQHGHTASSSVTVDFGSLGATPPTITVTAPTGDEVVAAGIPYTIRWTTTAGSGAIDRFSVAFSPDDGAHYSAGARLLESSRVSDILRVEQSEPADRDGAHPRPRDCQRWAVGQQDDGPVQHSHRTDRRNAPCTMAAAGCRRRRRRRQRDT